jgi:hypothetical protein
LWSTPCPTSGSGLSPACCQPSCLSSLCLLKVPGEINSLPLPPSLVHFQSSRPLCCVLVFSPLFIVQFFGGELFLFAGVGGQSAQGAMLVYPRGGWRSPVWSAKCLPSRLGAGGWQQQQSCFLSVRWRREAFHGLGVQGIEVLILIGALFLPSVAPASQQGF